MNSIYLTDPKYDAMRNLIRRWRDQQLPWEQIYLAKRSTEEELQQYLINQNDNSAWELLTTDEWREIVKGMEESERRAEISSAASRAAQLNDGSADTDFSIPEDPNSSWQLYRAHLIKDEEFTKESVDNIEKSCLAILKRMSRNTTESGPVKGLVIGNVQSGKTANMAGLMAMAADWGWNVFIVLSGTIEALRKQTQTRLYNDLHRPGNLNWNSIEQPRKNAPVGQKASDLSLEYYGQQRYLTVVLKVRSRLKNLIEWIEDDRQNIQNMRVLVIDDEADQASINTADVYSNEDRKTINRLILNLVHCRNHAAKNNDDNTYNSHYQAMNYISYTATPYANCLNEIGKDTLYPENFMKTLPVSGDYFGPKQIFGIKDADVETLDIVREVPSDDVDYINNNIHAGFNTSTVPDSLKDAILWFICAAAIMRSNDYKNPVSMLIHTSQKQDYHSFVADAVQNWIRDNKNKIPALCKKLYKTETTRLTKPQLFNVMRDYSFPADKVWDYPEFDTLIPHIKELVSDITAIKLDDEGDLTYSKHIHLCIDNCKNNGINGGEHMRLAYPDDNNPNRPNYATAFIVIGGNTLSRGLTIKGLVSTFFLRTVKQADTLMQMGRWFGYRRKYELLPRVWMPEEARNKFEFLAELDFDLRDQIYQMALQGLTPADFRPALINSPKVSWMRLTSKNKMQSAENTVFYGMDTQLTVYSTKIDEIQRNLAATVNLLSKLGASRPAYKGTAFVWDNVPFKTIKKELFDKGFTVPATSTAFQEIDALAEWAEEMTTAGKLKNWNVVAVGNIVTDDLPGEEIWTLPDGNRLAKIHRSAKTIGDNRLNIGVLSSKRDYLTDIRKEQLSADTWANIERNINVMYRAHRRNAGMEDVPVFLIYRISRHSDVGAAASTERIKLELDEDLIGITLVTPKVTAGEKQRVRIKTNGIE